MEIINGNIKSPTSLNIRGTESDQMPPVCFS